MSAEEPSSKSVTVLVPITDEAGSLIEIHEALSRQLDRLGLGCEFLYLVGTARRESLDEVRLLWERDAGRFGHRVPAEYGFCLTQFPGRMVDVQAVQAASPRHAVQAVPLGEEVLERSADGLEGRPHGRVLRGECRQAV